MESNKNMTVDDYLNSVNYDFSDYIPKKESLGFVNFMKLVAGNVPEEHKTPPVHLKLLDNIFSKKRKQAILCHRGFAKSTLLTTYLPFYMAVYGKLDGFGVVNYVLMVLDSQEGGAKTVRKSLELTWGNSEFLQKYLPKTRFTDTFVELENLDGHRIGIKLTGAQQSIRGTRYTNSKGSHRPELAILDDILSDVDAKSPTVIANINNTIYKAVDKALNPNRRKTVYIGTVFNSSDPLFQAVESGRWSPSVFPVCEKFPCTREEFRGSWPDRFSYDVVKEMYDDAIAAGRISDFNGEMMNRTMSDEDRLVQDDDIVRYDREQVLNNKDRYNFYITTDFATSEKTSADFSVISVWAYNNNGDWMWVDGVCARQLMDKNINDLFRLAQEYKPQSVGIEVSGQQGGFIPWIMDQMVTRNIYFPLASENNNGKAGIRPTTNKMQRFNVVVPLFKAKKLYFPVEMKDEFIMREMYNELSLVTPVEFKSKHDDFIDTISMLALISAYKPSQEVPRPKEEDSSPFWNDLSEESDTRMQSYII